MGNRVLVFYGSYRAERKGIHLARFVVAALAAPAAEGAALLAKTPFVA